MSTALAVLCANQWKSCRVSTSLANRDNGKYGESMLYHSVNNVCMSNRERAVTSLRRVSVLWSPSGKWLQDILNQILSQETSVRL